MIDYYLNKPELNTSEKIKECYIYYQNKDYSFEELYSEYNNILKLKPKLEFDNKNIFFKKNNKLNKINTIFMKECLLESLKRLVENKSYKDIQDINSELTHDIEFHQSMI